MKRLILALLVLAAGVAADEALVRVGPLTHAEVAVLELEHPLMVDGYSEGYAYCYVGVEHLHHLARLPHPWVVLVENIQAAFPPDFSGDRSQPWTYYPTYEETIAMLEGWAADPLYADICRVVDLGLTSVQERTLMALVISADVHEVGYEPKVRILGAHHGNERITNVVTLYTAERLLTGYRDGIEGVVDLVDNMEIWLQPLVNPDGYVHGWRRNAENVDLNRNYSYQWQYRPYNGSGSHPFSEPETKVVADFSGGDEAYVPDNLENNAFVLGLSHHSGAVCLNYVWNYQLDPLAPDHLHIRDNLCQSYSDGCKESPHYDDLTYQDSHGGYMEWITHGADWYITYGDTNDWSYGMRGCIDTTVELSDDKLNYPREGTILQLCDVNWMGTKRYIAWALHGLHGRCTDENDEPILTMITVNDRDEAFFYNDPRVHGDYWLSLDVGFYDIVFSADGYEPVVHYGVEVTGRDTPPLDIRFGQGSSEQSLDFSGSAIAEGNLLRWSAATDFAAYNVYLVGPRGTEVGRRLNDRPLPAGTRSYLDLTTDDSPRTYRLEAISDTGHRLIFGPVEVHRPPRDERLSIGCYPQPARVSVNLVLELPAGEATLSLYDLAGRRLHRETLHQATAGERTMTLDVGGLSSGVYLVSLETADRRVSRRLVISR